MNLKMSYNSFIKLKDFFKIVDITAEIKEYITKNDVLEGTLEIHGKYQKRDGISEEYFLESVPFSIVFPNSDYDINDIDCTDIDYIAIDGRGVDLTFDILVDYYQYEEIPVVINQLDKETIETNNLDVETSVEMIDDRTVESATNSNLDVDDRDFDNNTEKVINEVIESNDNDNSLELETEQIDEIEIEKIKEMETKRVDELLKSALNFKDDNLPTEEIIVRNIPESKSCLKVCYYNSDQELEKVCEKNNVSLDKVFKSNRNRNIEKFHRVIINEQLE